MDVVYPYIKDGSHWNENELRHSLRSLDKYFLNIGEVFIVGHKPSWTKGVVHIECDDPYPDNKGANIINKLIVACKDDQISSDFLFMSDDQYMLVPMRSKDIETYYVSNLKNQKLSKGNKFWMKCLKNMRSAMEREGLPCYNFEPHTPVIINKRKYWSTMMNYDYENTLYPTLSIYFNTVLSHHKPLPDNYRARFSKDEISLDIISGKQFLYHNDLGLSYALQQEIKRLFPKRCRFER